MKYPTRRFLGFTWVGWLNRLLAQWLWFRIQGCINVSGQCQWQVIAPVAPFTGWKHSYWPANHRTFNLTKGC